MTDIQLGSGADNYTATTAGDYIHGNEGNDTLIAAPGGNFLDGGAGSDVLAGGAGNDNLVGGSDPNTTELNILRGNGGNDTIQSGSFGDMVYGGKGDDQVSISAMRTGQHIDGGADTDTLILYALAGFSDPVFVQMGTTFQPRVGGIAGATYLNFENLIVFGGTGANTLIGGSGEDSISNTLSNVSLFTAGDLRGGGGDDVVGFSGLALGGGVMKLAGGLGDDRLEWTGIAASLGALVVDGTAGTLANDGIIFANFKGFEALSITTNSGNAGSVVVAGGAEADRLDLSGSTASIEAGDGNDTILFHTGLTTVHGGLGDDFVQIDFFNAEKQLLQGDGGNDTLAGGTGQSTILGGDGNDNVSANNGRSIVRGGAGDDSLSMTSSYSIAGSGHAILDGGAGHDSLILELSTSTFTYVADFSQTSFTLSDGTRITGVEAVTLTSGAQNDDLTASNDIGGALTNKFLGYFGDDTLRAGSNGARLDGGPDNDLLLGAGGADLLIGGYEDDTLRGGGGKDTVTGGFGKDVLSGAAAGDLFVFGNGETGTGTAARDVITDFSHAQHDKIDLHSWDADGSFANGITAFTFIGTAAFDNHAGQLRFQQFDRAGTANDTTIISGDTAGLGAATFQIELKGLIALVAGDFTLV